MWDLIADAAIVIIQPENLFLAFIGAAMGTVFGAMPGVSATLSIALLVPVTFEMTATSGLIF
nr:tripartite tricarboxylate transporter permease [Alphaproteobacteria bacterium]